ncbi:hypothetical protein AB3R30_21700 [Leptolyngbyaceae cyanobacterium UHCC 1019]
MWDRRVLVGSREIHILEDVPEYEGLSDSKHETYRLLWALSFIGGGFDHNPYSIATRDFMKLLGLGNNPLPLQARFTGLEELGKIRINRTKTAIAA